LPCVPTFSRGPSPAELEGIRLAGHGLLKRGGPTASHNDLHTDTLEQLVQKLVSFNGITLNGENLRLATLLYSSLRSLLPSEPPLAPLERQNYKSRIQELETDISRLRLLDPLRHLGIRSQEVTCEELVGEGKTAVVYRGKFHGEEVAIKQFKRRFHQEKRDDEHPSERGNIFPRCGPTVDGSGLVAHIMAFPPTILRLAPSLSASRPPPPSPEFQSWIRSCKG
ncbi:unnamed protein product, partial [Cyprideis torosa]